MTLMSRTVFRGDRQPAVKIIDIKQLLDAWLRELARLASRRTVVLPKHHVMILGMGQVSQILVRRGPSMTLVPGAPEKLSDPADWHSLHAGLKKMGLNRLPLVIRLPASQTLERNLQLPSAVANVIDPVLRHQVQRITPWTESDTAFAYTIGELKRGATAINVTMVAAHKPPLDAARHAAQAAGMTVALVDCANEPSDPPRYILFDTVANSVAKTARTIGLTLGIAICATLVSGGVGLWRYLETHRHYETLNLEVAAVESRFAAKQDVTATSTQSEKAAQFIQGRKAQEPAKLETLSLLTKLLPDSAYLTQLSIDRKQAVLTGYARDTAHLVAALDSTAKLTNVHLTGTTTRNGPDGRETFRISAQIPVTSQSEGDR